MEKEEIIKFIDNFTNIIESDNMDLYKNIIENSSIKKFDDVEDFDIMINYDWSNFIDSFVKINISNSEDVAFIYKNYSFIERHFVKLIEKYEGFSCCADKSRSIIKGIVNFYQSDIKIQFNYDAEYTYHLTKKIFTSHDEIIDFYQGLKFLYYGNNEKYLKAYSELLKKVKENN